MYLAFDPGMRTGVAHFNRSGKLLLREILELPELMEFLEEVNWPNVHGVMYEEYIVDPNIRQGGSKNEASQVIGMLRIYCNRYKIGFHPVQRTVKNEGLGWAGIPRPKGHWPDDIAAVAIGTYWLVKNKIITKGTLPLDAY